MLTGRVDRTRVLFPPPRFNHHVHNMLKSFSSSFFMESLQISGGGGSGSRTVNAGQEMS